MLETLYNLLEQLLRDVPNAQPSKMDHYTRTMAQLNRYLDKLENEIEEEECPEIEWLLSPPEPNGRHSTPSAIHETKDFSRPNTCTQLKMYAALITMLDSAIPPTSTPTIPHSPAPIQDALKSEPVPAPSGLLCNECIKMFPERDGTPQAARSVDVIPESIGEMICSALVPAPDANQIPVPESNKMLLQNATQIPESNKMLLQNATQIPASNKMLLQNDTQIPAFNKMLLQNATQIPENIMILLQNDIQIPASNKKLIQNATWIPASDMIVVILVLVVSLQEVLSGRFASINVLYDLGDSLSKCTNLPCCNP